MLEDSDVENIPKCSYYDEDTNTFIEEGCWLINKTETTMTCGCVHLTTFVGEVKKFKPTVRIIKLDEIENLSWDDVLYSLILI